MNDLVTSSLRRSEGLVVKGQARLLTQVEFARLADVPPETQWFANLDSAQTRRAYKNDLRAFMLFTGISKPEEFRIITRGHILAWRADLEKQVLAGATIRRKLAALASLYEYLRETNAVTHNPVKGVKRPKVDSYEGKTPALGDGQVRALLEAPPTDTLKGKRDCAILSVLLYHALRRKELTKLLVKDFNQLRRGGPSLAGAGQRRQATLHPNARPQPAPGDRVLGCGRSFPGPGWAVVSAHDQPVRGTHRNSVDAGWGLQCCGGALHEAGRHHGRKHGAACFARYCSDQRVRAQRGYR